MKTPSDILDLSHWALQLPTTGNTLSQNLTKFEMKPFFYVDDEKGVVLQVIGPTDKFKKTSNSQYFRTELREIEPACWDLSDETPHILEIDMTVDSYSGKGVVIAQIHGPSELPNMELRVCDEGIIVEDHKNKQGTTIKNPKKLTTKYQKGTRFHLKIVGGKGSISIEYSTANKKPVLVSYKSCYKQQYFKTGAYCQDNGDNPNCKVRIYSLKLHS